MAKNVIKVAPEKFPWLDLRRYTFSMGTERHGVTYVSGQTASAFDAKEGHVVCKGDILEQAKVVWQKIGVVLESAGLTYDNIVKINQYVDPKGMAKLSQLAEIRKQFAGDTPIAVTTILVHNLLRNDALLEISSIAVRDPKKSIMPSEFQAAKPSQAPGILAGNRIWLSGVAGAEKGPTGNEHYAEQAILQTERAYQQAEAVLKAAGATRANVAHEMMYVSPQGYPHYADTRQVRRNFYKGAPPAVGTFSPYQLPASPNAQVEIDLTATIGLAREEVKVPGWEKSYQELGAAPAVKSGNLLYFSAQGPVDHRTGQVVGNDVVAQGRKAYQNIAEICAIGGYDMSDILYTIEYMPPGAVEEYRGIGGVRREFFGDSFPSATGVLIHALPDPRALIYVSAVAVV